MNDTVASALSSTTLPDEKKEGFHTIAVYVQNQPSVLNRVVLVFSRRGFNIESLVVSSTTDPKFSTMTITAQGDEKEILQVIKQVKKLVNVISVKEYKKSYEVIDREIALIKIKTNKEERITILQILDHFKAHTIDLTDHSLVLQITGTTEKVNACITLLKAYQIVEIIRSGKIIMKRGVEKT